MDIIEAYRQRALRFREWGEAMARADGDNGYPLLRALSHTAMNHGVLQNALRKKKTDVLERWLVGIERFYGTQARLKEPPLRDIKNTRHPNCELRAFWMEESDNVVTGIKKSWREWDNYLASKADHHYFDADEVILNYGLVVANALGWETISTSERWDDLNHHYRWGFKAEFGDWLLFPSVDITTELKEHQGEVRCCRVRANFYPVRKDEFPADLPLREIALNQPYLHFSPHDFMGLDWVGWHLGSTTHADEVWESYLSLMHTFHHGFECNLRNLGISD